MSHLDEGTLTALFDGELGAPEREQAEQHLAGCGECRRLYTEIRGFADEAGQLVDSLQPAERKASPAPRPARPGWERYRPLAWAATLILAAGLGWSASTLRFNQGEASDAVDGLAEQRAPATPTSALPEESRDESPSPEARERAGARQDGAPRRQVTQPPAPIAADMAKAAAPAPARNEAEPAANAVGRVESSPPPNPPAALVGTEPLQARGAEVSALREAPQGAYRYRETSLEQAVRVLGGSVKLIDGLNPIRVQAGPSQPVPGGPALEVIRITYLDPPGRELWLDQQRHPAAAEVDAAPVADLLAGDTTVTSAGDGQSRVRWISADGFRLTLTGYLPGDSLRSLVRRVH